MIRLCSIVLLGVLLSGCGTMSATPDEMIQNVKGGGMFAQADTYDVNRPFAQVSETFRTKAPECLRRKLRITMQQAGRASSSTVRVYTPRVIVGNNRTRLTLQEKFEGQKDLGKQPPPDGWYILVADAYPLGPNKTRVESYLNADEKIVFGAIRSWAEGTNMGCPDLTQ